MTTTYYLGIIFMLLGVSIIFILGTYEIDKHLENVEKQIKELKKMIKKTKPTF